MATDLRPAKSTSAAKYDMKVQRQLARARSRIRALDLAAAIFGLATATLAYSLVMALLDRRLELSPLSRQVAFALFAAGTILYAGMALIRPICRRINPYYAARLLEQTLPAAKNSVVNWLDLHDHPLPPALQKALGQRAAKDLDQTDLDRAVSTRRVSWLGGSTLALFLALLVLFVLGPRQFGSLLNRAFAPFLSASLATRTQLILVRPEEGNLSLPLGRPVPIVVQVEGRVPDPRKPDALKLHFRYNPTDPPEERPLKRGDSSEWEITIPATQVHNGFWYKVSGGDAETPEYRVQVRSTPLVTGFDVIYQYRKYLGWRPETTHDPNLQGPRGTEVTLLAHTNRTVKEGQLSSGDDPPLSAERVADDPQTLRFRFVLEKNAAYRIWFTSVEGERNTDPRPYTIRVLPDLPPQVELTEPGQDIELPCNGLLRLAGSATDDFGVAGLTLRMQVVNGPVLQAKTYRPGKSFRLADGSYPQVVEYKDFVELDQVKRESGLHVALEPGQAIEYWLEATDNCDYPAPNLGKSKLYKVTLTPPQKDPAKQEPERQRARQEQQQHAKAQDQKQEQLNQERQAQAQSEGASQGQGSEDQVRKQAEALQRALEQQEREKGKGEGQGEKSPEPQGEGKPEPKAESTSGQRQDKGEGKPEPRPQQNPGKGESQGAVEKKGEEKPQPNPDMGQDKGTGGTGSKDPSQEQGRKPPDAKPGTGQEQGAGKPDSATKPGPSPKPDPANTNPQPGQQQGEGKPTPKSEKAPERSPDQPGAGGNPQGTKGGNPPGAEGTSQGNGKPSAGAGETPGAPKSASDAATGNGSTQGQKQPSTPNPGTPAAEAGTKGEQQGGVRQPAPGTREKDNGQGEGTPNKVSDLAKALQSGDPKTRRDAARELAELSRSAPDAETRRAAGEALKQADRNDLGKSASENEAPNQRSQGDRSPEGQRGGAGASTGNSGKTGAEGDAGDSKRGNDKAGQGKAAARSDKGSGPMGDPGSQSGNSGTGRKSESRDGSAGSGGSGTGNDSPPPTQEAEPGAAANASYQKKASALQLEEFKKRVDKDVLRQLKWTDEDYQKFLKNYEEMLQREAPESPQKEDLATPRRGGGNLPNQGVQRVNSGSQTKTGSLERGGTALPPPEFREAQKRLTQKLAELKRERDQKGTSDKKP